MLNLFLPNYCMLVSPVVDLGEYAHKGSRQSLLGENPSEDLVQQYSVQNFVTERTAPTFIVDAFNDAAVSPMNSLLYYQALLKHGVATGFHVFPQVGHEIALRNNPRSANLWTDIAEEWMIEMELLPSPKR